MRGARKISLLNGIRGRCPRCGGTRLFKTRFRLHDHCPDCSLPLEQEDGWSLGAIPLNYAITCIFWILPVALLFAVGILSIKTALIIAGLGAVVLPVLTYRLSKSLWAGLYYAVLPHELDPPPEKEQ